VKITVITVSYNSAATIAHTLDSVAAQTHPDIEHLVLDGASVDRTVDMVHANGSPYVRLISEPDHGMYDAMNKGIAMAAGEIIGFLNSDDYFRDSDVLALIAREFESSGVDACYGDLVYVNPTNGKVVRYWKSRIFKKGDFAIGWCPAHPTFYVRRSVFQQFGGFDLTYRLGSDVELMMRFLERGGIAASYIPSVLVCMRTGGVSNQSWKNIMIQNQEIYKALRNNGVSFSPWLFWIFKLTRRFWQRFVGRFQHAS
jgi:glycosyltransferase involved in cell wall biosynthesis